MRQYIILILHTHTVNANTCTHIHTRFSLQEKARAHKWRIERVERKRLHTQHMYQQARANEMAMRK